MRESHEQVYREGGDIGKLPAALSAATSPTRLGDLQDFLEDAS